MSAVIRHQTKAVPFADAAEAWLWTMACLRARRDGARYTARQGRVERPCEPDDMVKVLDALYHKRDIDLVHARVLRLWGDRGVAPDAGSSAQRHDSIVWQEAMLALEAPLRAKGMIA